MFLRLFNIFLISAYYFCGYAQITGYKNVHDLKEILFTDSKNRSAAGTLYFKMPLQKHTHSYNVIKLSDQAKDFKTHFLFARSFIAYHYIPSENNIFKVTLDSPLNKAPPAFI